MRERERAGGRPEEGACVRERVCFFSLYHCSISTETRGPQSISQRGEEEKRVDQGESGGEKSSSGTAEVRARRLVGGGVQEMAACCLTGGLIRLQSGGFLWNHTLAASSGKMAKAAQGGAIPEPDLEL